MSDPGWHEPIDILFEDKYGALLIAAISMHMDYEQAHAHVIREALNQELVLGWEDFKDKIERIMKRQVRPSQPGRPRVEDKRAVY